jgi:excisionase family DNA binding protein
MANCNESTPESAGDFELEAEVLPVSPTISGMADDGEGRKITDGVILSVEDIVQYLKVNQASVYRWIADGSLKGIRVGPRLWRIREEDFKAFLDAGGVPIKDKAKDEGTEDK